MVDVLSGITIAEEALPLVLQIFEAAIGAAQTVASDTGKPWPQVAQDVINHLTRGQPNSPSLS